MALLILTWICALFMIGRNLPSLIFKVRDIVIEKKRKQWIETPSKLFTLITLVITAVAGLVCGISLLFSNIAFGYYLFIVVSGMMIYSYFTYAGTCYEEKKWFIFGLCMFLIIFTSVLLGMLSFYMATGIID